MKAISLICLALIATMTLAYYDEDLAKSYMTYSRLTYCKLSELEDPPYDCTNCDDLHNGDSKFLHKFEKENNLVGDTVSYSAFAHEERQELIFAFRGTNTVAQLIEEGFTQKAVPYELHDIDNAYAMHYFYDAYSDDLRDDFISTYKKYSSEYSSYKTVVTGHSLGAALSTLASLDLSMSGLVSKSDLTVYNFGSPRVGNVHLAEAIDEHVPTLYRVIHWADVFCHIPPCKVTDGVCDPTKEFEGELYFWPAYHAGTQVFYTDDQTSYQICSAEDPNCANQFSKLQYSVKDHLDYFGIKSGCGTYKFTLFDKSE